MCAFIHGLIRAALAAHSNVSPPLLEGRNVDLRAEA